MGASRPPWARRGGLTICYRFGMAAVHIRDLDDALVARLKNRAAKNRRSLQGELKTILEAAAAPEKGRGAKVALTLHKVRVKAKGTSSREEIYGDDGR